MKKVLLFIVFLSFMVFPLPSVDNSLVNQVEGVFTTTSVKQVVITSNTLNFRTGASTKHRIIKNYPKGTVFDVIGKIGNWYVVKNSKDTVGCMDGRYLKVYSPSTSSPESFTAMQLEMLGYINSERKANGLTPLTLTKKLSDGAYLKSKDMADNDYFSHNSPTYGTPFDMMKSLGISYAAAGENIALNSTIKGAHTAFMNSSGHRANILSTNFSHLGLGIYQDNNRIYITQWFTN